MFHFLPASLDHPQRHFQLLCFVVNNALNLVPELGIRSRWHEHDGVLGAIPGGLGEKLLPVPRLPVPVPGPVRGQIPASALSSCL